MRREAFHQAILEFLTRKPFRPFTVELSSGSRFVVTHPEALTVDSTMIVYNEADKDEHGEAVQQLFDSSSVLRLHSIPLPPHS